MEVGGGGDGGWRGQVMGQISNKISTHTTTSIDPRRRRRVAQRSRRDRRLGSITNNMPTWGWVT
jgi:hypothetical protein